MYQTTKTSLQGEVSDWMLAKHGIYALSPKLGTQFKYTGNILDDSIDTLQDNMRSNYPWIKNTILKLIPKTTVKITNVFEPIRKSYKHR